MPLAPGTRLGPSEVASIIGSIMKAELAALATLQPLTPPALERIVKKCLAKQPDDRWDTAKDAGDDPDGSPDTAVPRCCAVRGRWTLRSGTRRGDDDIRNAIRHRRRAP